MVTPAFNFTATERVLPALALDFTTGILDPRITFTRTSTGTYYAESGVLQTASSNVARFQHNPLTGANLGLIREAQGTNLMRYSEEFDNAVWSVIDITVQTNQLIAPDGTLTMDKLVESSTDSVKVLFGVAPVVNGVNYTQTFFAKPAGRQFIQIYGADGFGSTIFQNYDLVNGTLGSSNGVVGASIIPVGNGIYRCSATMTPSSTNNDCRIPIALIDTISSARVASYQGDGVSGVYIWGAQLEANAYPTSYIKTEASQVTRAADIATMTGANFTDWYNINAGTFFINTNARNSDVLLTAGSYTLSANATALKKYATTYTSDQSATQLDFGLGTIQYVSYYKQALTAAELAALTA
jgi:hypothetical protein